MSVTEVAIVGAGVAGLVCAHELRARGMRCTVFEAEASVGRGCSHHGGGMLAPLSELDHAEPVLARFGLDAPRRWEAILGPQAAGVAFDRRGSLLLAHRPEWPLLTQIHQRALAAGLADRLAWVDEEAIVRLEPWTAGRMRRGLFIEDEGVVHPRVLLTALREDLAAKGVVFRMDTPVRELHPGRVVTHAGEIGVGTVIDCRGLGAAARASVRGVRGEYVVLRSCAVTPARPLRLMHPRYPLYVIPRPDGRLYVGATQLESEDDSPMQVRSALELLSALYSLDPAFGDAEIEAFGVGLRPAFVDNLPRVDIEPGLIAVNGLFRHGFLLAPRLGALVADAVLGNPIEPDAVPFCRFLRGGD